MGILVIGELPVCFRLGEAIDLSSTLVRFVAREGEVGLSSSQTVAGLLMGLGGVGGEVWRRGADALLTPRDVTLRR